MDNEIFKNWWRNNNMKTIDPLENAFVVNYPSTTIPTHDGYNTNHTGTARTDSTIYQLTDKRWDAVSELSKNVTKIAEILATLERRIENNEEITLEKAINFLTNIGWLQNHDKILTANNQCTTKVKNIECINSFWEASGRCGVCNSYIDRKYPYCPYCGSKLIWEQNDRK